MEAIINKDADTKTISKGKFKETGLSKLQLVKRANALKKEGDSYIATWKDLQTYIYPTKGFFHTTTPNQGSKIDHTTLIDEEGTIDTDTFAAGMMSGFTSPSRPWFKLFLEDKALMELDSVKYWISDVQDIMYGIYQKSNTYTVLHSMFKELAAFSTACAYVEEDYETVITLRDYTIGEYYLGRDNKGRLNAFYRRFWMTIGQMVTEFGLENLSPQSQALYQNNTPDTWVIVNHLIEENTDRIPFLKDYSNMPYRSVYWEDNENEDSYLRVGGYEEFPILAPRFGTRTTASVYGTGGCGWKALGSVKELQKKVKEQLIGLAKTNNPPLQKDAHITGDVNVMPGGITTSSSMAPNAGVRPTYQVNIDIASMDASIEKTKAKIRKFFYADLFLMMIEAERSGSPLTATEIVERQSERLSKLGPLLEMWQGDEFIKALIDRTFNICVRNGIFPEPPPEIAGQDLKIQYISILAQAQKMVDIAAIDQWVASVAEEAGINPGSLDIINWDEKNKFKAEAMGIPPKLVNSLETMAQIRKSKAEAQAQIENSQKMMEMAEGAQKGAKAVESLSKAKMGENNALDKTVDAVNKMNQ